MAHKMDTLIIGAGQAGLALSRALSAHRIDHLVLERGQVGERWRSQRRASLRLLTPNWMNVLPGHNGAPGDPDGFMSRDEVRFLKGYADTTEAPLQEGTMVERVSALGDGFSVITDRGLFCARAVVLATGACDRARRPAVSAAVSPAILQLDADTLGDPRDLPPGRILVVGASASGVQIAEEVARAGREVTLAVGAHVRIPRHYRGRDIFRWLDASGFLNDPRRPISGGSSERQPSFQLVGCPSQRDIDLGRLQDLGITLAGRLTGVDGTAFAFANDLAAQMGAAEARMQRLLDRIDGHIATAQISTAPADRPKALGLRDGIAALDGRQDRIGAVIWATGYRPDYRWLDLPAFREDGELDQTGGITRIPRLYALGLPFMRHRSSTFMRGAGADACALAEIIAAQFGAEAPAAA